MRRLFLASLLVSAGIFGQSVWAQQPQRLTPCEETRNSLAAQLAEQITTINEQNRRIEALIVALKQAAPPAQAKPEEKK